MVEVYFGSAFMALLPMRCSGYLLNSTFRAFYQNNNILYKEHLKVIDTQTTLQNKLYCTLMHEQQINFIYDNNTWLHHIRAWWTGALQLLTSVLPHLKKY